MAKYVANKSLCNISLRRASLSISIFFLVSLLLGVIAQPSLLHDISILVAFIISLLQNLALLFGVVWSNAWLVLAWLVICAPFFICWPFAVLAVIFNVGDLRAHFAAAASTDSVFVILLNFLLVLVIYGYAAYLVYSYFHQLRRIQSTPSQGF